MIAQVDGARSTRACVGTPLLDHTQAGIVRRVESGLSSDGGSPPVAL